MLSTTRGPRPPFSPLPPQGPNPHSFSLPPTPSPSYPSCPSLTGAGPRANAMRPRTASRVQVYLPPPSHPESVASRRGRQTRATFRSPPGGRTRTSGQRVRISISISVAFCWCVCRTPCRDTIGRRTVCLPQRERLGCSCSPPQVQGPPFKAMAVDQASTAFILVARGGAGRAFGLRLSSFRGHPCCLSDPLPESIERKPSGRVYVYVYTYIYIYI